MAERNIEMDGRRIGLRVRRERNRLTWSQEHLAYRSGVNRDTIASLETGKSNAPGADTVYLLARALGVEFEYLLTGLHRDELLPPERVSFAKRIAATLPDDLPAEDLSLVEQFLARMFLRGPQREAQQPAEQETPNEGTGDAPHAQSGGR